MRVVFGVQTKLIKLTTEDLIGAHLLKASSLQWMNPLVKRLGQIFTPRLAMAETQGTGPSRTQTNEIVESIKNVKS